jgi:hypothetical protein
MRDKPLTDEERNKTAAARGKTRAEILSAGARGSSVSSAVDVEGSPVDSWWGKNEEGFLSSSRRRGARRAQLHQLELQPLRAFRLQQSTLAHAGYGKSDHCWMSWWKGKYFIKERIKTHIHPISSALCVQDFFCDKLALSMIVWLSMEFEHEVKMKLLYPYFTEIICQDSSIQLSSWLRSSNQFKYIHET